MDNREEIKELAADAFKGIFHDDLLVETDLSTEEIKKIIEEAKAENKAASEESQGKRLDGTA